VNCRLRWMPDMFNIRIDDKGIGMTPEDLGNIFQPFFRAENARRYHGHGIGLALAEKIIRLHGGSIHIDSTLNIGTQVSVSLPHNHF
jgi:signal transduction histidine kinase